MNSDRTLQEFYCRHCPADDPDSDDQQKRRTGGHFRCKLSTGYDANITLHCPRCKHTHTRHVKGGVIHDGYGDTSFISEELKVPRSAWSRDAQSVAQAKARQEKPQDHYQPVLRGGAVIASDEDRNDGWDAARDVFLSDLWVQSASNQQQAVGESHE